MLVKLLGNEIFSSLTQFLNASAPTETTPSSISTVFNWAQSANVPFLIVLILPGIVTDVRLLQFWKALVPIVVTASGMFIDDKAKQPLKAKSPMEATPSGMLMDTSPLQP